MGLVRSTPASARICECLFLYGISIGILHAQTILGTLDLTNNSGCSVAGWAKDPLSTSPIQVRIYRDGDATTGTLVSSFTADLLRTDLPFTDQNHGFNQTLTSNPLLADGKSHT